MRLYKINSTSKALHQKQRRQVLKCTAKDSTGYQKWAKKKKHGIKKTSKDAQKKHIKKISYRQAETDLSRTKWRSGLLSILRSREKRIARETSGIRRGGSLGRPHAQVWCLEISRNSSELLKISYYVESIMNQIWVACLISKWVQKRV